MTTLVDWARSRSADATVTLGAAAVRLRTYGGDGRDLLNPVEGLRVVDLATGWVAVAHPASALHGFTAADGKPVNRRGLPAGPRTLRAEDPAGRWLPRDIAVTVPDRAAFAAALAAGTPLPAVSPAPQLDVAVYPTALRAIPVAESVVWGVVTVAGAPAPFAYVQVEVDGTVYRGGTDPTGVYLLWLHGQFPDELSTPTATLTVAAASAPLEALPVDFDVLVPGTLDFAARYGPPVSQAIAGFVLGQRLRPPDIDLP